MGRNRRFLLASFLLAVAAVTGGCYGAAPTPAPVLPGASLGIPDAVTNRTPLYPCGSETLPKGIDDYNEPARDCFWTHNQNRQEAEFVAVTQADFNGDNPLTVYLTLYYRTFTDGHVEIITDGRSHPTIAGWTLRKCAGLELAPAGDAPPGVTFFNGKEPCTQTYLLKAGSSAEPSASSAAS